MIRSRQHRKSLTSSAAIACVAALASAGIALAAQPLKGKTYSGTFKGESFNKISFKVSANGKQVSGFNVPTPPVGCQGGAFGSAVGGKASISKQGTFKVTLKMIFMPLHRTDGTVLVTGAFAKHGAENGKIASTFTNKAFTKSCDATIAYSTKG